MSSDFIPAHLSPEFEQALRPLMKQRVFAKGATLYRHGMKAEGLYLLEGGAVRVLVPASDNQNQLLEVAGEGAILGLSEALSGETFRATVEADETTTASFIARSDFVALLNGNHEFSMELVRLLSDSLHGLYHRFRSVCAHPGR
ncbi:MAG: Crp/Fnr family transcriptional regulator, partial [Terriglobales bacterium]